MKKGVPVISNTINLCNVNISIDEFQRISSGKHNAGEVMLLNENTLDRMNHHVHATLLNGDKISHNEVIAIKEAFVKTLSQNGLSQEEINGIRQQLGRQLSSLYLALSQSAMGALKGQCFKSLGYTTDEHMAMTFTLAKNEETGAISITYTPLEGYPVKFSWTTTIGIDGKATSTPIVIQQ